MNKVFKLTLITIITFIFFLFFVGIFFNLSFTIENLTTHIVRIIIIAFFTLSVSTPILMNIKANEIKDIKRYIVTIITFFLILIITYWGINIIKYEEKIHTLNSTSNIASSTLKNKEEQEQFAAEILEKYKEETYKEYVSKGIIEIFIMLISILGIQRFLLLKNPKLNLTK